MSLLSLLSLNDRSIPLSPSDAISDLRHQCHQRPDSPAAELKRGRTKSGADGQSCCQIFADFVQKELRRGRTSKKNFEVLLFSLNLGKFKKYYTFQFSNKNSQRLFFSEAQMPLKQ
jgi:hypothetical protein